MFCIRHFSSLIILPWPLRCEEQSYLVEFQVNNYQIIHNTILTYLPLVYKICQDPLLKFKNSLVDFEMTDSFFNLFMNKKYVKLPFISLLYTFPAQKYANRIFVAEWFLQPHNINKCFQKPFIKRFP